MKSVDAIEVLGPFLLGMLIWGSPRLGAQLRSYDAPRVSSEIVIDGRLDEEAWAVAAPSDPFIDIRGAGHATPTWETRVRIVWDDDFLYVGAFLEEPHLWGTLTERDAIIWHDHDFEVFLDPDGDGLGYFELEVNTLGAELDLFMDRPYVKGGKADIEWDMVGLRSAVHLNGTVNDATDVDVGWGIEVAIPWDALVAPGTAPRGSPPAPGDTWRMNFSRVQWPLRTTTDGGYMPTAEPSFQVHHENNWVWSPQGAINMHIPEMWGVVRFVQRGVR